MNSFEQLNLSNMEIDMLQHAAGLSHEQVAANAKLSQPIPREQMKPLSVTHIGPEDVKKFDQKLPYMVQPSAGANAPEIESNIVSEYIDPMQVYKPIDRIQVRDDDINDRMTLKSQYK